MINRFYRLKSPRLFDIDFVNEELKENQIIVRPTYLSICNSDLKYFYGKKDEAILKKRLPLCLIHEAIGTVVYDPKGKFQVGEQVVLIPLIEIIPQDKVKGNYVKENRFSSSTAEGFTRDIVLIDRNRVLSTNELDPKIAVFMEIMTIGINSIKTLMKLKQDFEKIAIAIWGDGNIGYTLSVLIKYYFPNSELTVIGKSGSKFSYYPFADHIFTSDEIPKEMTFDCAFECVGGSQSALCIEQILDHIEPQGYVSLIGLSEEKLPINIRGILEKGVVVIGNNRSDISDFVEAKKILLESETLRERIRRLCSDIVSVTNEQELTAAFDIDRNNEFKTLIKWES